jgi:ribosomal protein S18 acetylase RimI-like enzyme
MAQPVQDARRADVRVGPSSIAGLGAFALRPFEPGQTVLVLDDSRVVDGQHPLDESRDEWSHHRDFLAGGRAVLMPSPERYINSSCEPNTFVQTRADGRHVIARLRIEPGSEITYDYIVNCDGGETWKCRCGSATCRETVPPSFFDLAAPDQWRLAPLLDRWFVDEHPRPIRPPWPADVPTMTALSAELGYPVAHAVLNARLAEIIERDDQRVFVACDPGGRVVGWVHAAEHLMLEVERRCEILGLVVSSQCRRQGVGQRLVDAVEGWARHRGLAEVSVRSNIVRDSSHPFYEKLGYVRIKTQHAYRKPLGDAHTAR